MTFTATVTPIAPASATPTGSVQFYNNGLTLGSPVSLVDGVASLSTSDLPTGTNIVGAAYLGEGNFDGSTNSVEQVVNAIAQTPITLGLVNNGDGTGTVTFSGTPGAEYLVQASIDLGSPASWTSVSTNTAGIDGQWSLTDSTTAQLVRFYRSAKP